MGNEPSVNHVAKIALPHMVLIVEGYAPPASWASREPSTPRGSKGRDICAIVLLDGREVPGGRVRGFPSDPISIKPKRGEDEVTVTFFDAPAPEGFAEGRGDISSLPTCGMLSVAAQKLVHFGVPLFTSLWLGLGSQHDQSSRDLSAAFDRLRDPEVVKLRLTVFKPLEYSSLGDLSKVHPDCRSMLGPGALDDNYKFRLAQVEGVIRCLKESNNMVGMLLNSRPSLADANSNSGLQGMEMLCRKATKDAQRNLDKFQHARSKWAVNLFRHAVSTIRLQRHQAQCLQSLQDDLEEARADAVRLKTDALGQNGDATGKEMSLTAEIKKLSADHAKEIASMADTVEALTSQHASELSALRQSHSLEMHAIQTKSNDELARLREDCSAQIRAMLAKVEDAQKQASDCLVEKDRMEAEVKLAAASSNSCSGSVPEDLQAQLEEARCSERKRVEEEFNGVVLQAERHIAELESKLSTLGAEMSAKAEEADRTMHSTTAQYTAQIEAMMQEKTTLSAQLAQGTSHAITQQEVATDLAQKLEFERRKVAALELEVQSSQSSQQPRGDDQELMFLQNEISRLQSEQKESEEARSSLLSQLDECRKQRQEQTELLQKLLREQEARDAGREQLMQQISEGQVQQQELAEAKRRASLLEAMRTDLDDQIRTLKKELARRDQEREREMQLRQVMEDRCQAAAQQISEMEAKQQSSRSTPRSGAAEARSHFESELKAHQQRAASERAAYTRTFENDMAALKESMATKLSEATREIKEAQWNGRQESSQLRQQLEECVKEHSIELSRVRASADERLLSMKRAFATRGEEELSAVEARLQLATRAAREGLAEVRHEERRLAEAEKESQRGGVDANIRKQQEEEFMRQLEAERSAHVAVVSGLKNELQIVRDDMTSRLTSADKAMQDTKRARLEEVRQLQERLHDMEGRQVKLVAALNRHTGSIASADRPNGPGSQPLASPDEQLPSLREGLATMEQQVDELAVAFTQEIGVHPNVPETTACQQKLMVLKSQLQGQFRKLAIEEEHAKLRQRVVAEAAAATADSSFQLAFRPQGNVWMHDTSAATPPGGSLNVPPASAGGSVIVPSAGATGSVIAPAAGTGGSVHVPAAGGASSPSAPSRTIGQGTAAGYMTNGQFNFGGNPPSPSSRYRQPSQGAQPSYGASVSSTPPLTTRPGTQGLAVASVGLDGAYAAAGRNTSPGMSHGSPPATTRHNVKPARQLTDSSGVVHDVSNGQVTPRSPAMPHRSTRSPQHSIGVSSPRRDSGSACVPPSRKGAGSVVIPPQRQYPGSALVPAARGSAHTDRQNDLQALTMETVPPLTSVWSPRGGLMVPLRTGGGSVQVQPHSARSQYRNNVGGRESPKTRAPYSVEIPPANGPSASGSATIATSARERHTLPSRLQSAPAPVSSHISPTVVSSMRHQS